MIKKLEHDSLAADLASTNALLESLPQNDVLGRLGLQTRKAELEQSLRALEGQIETRAAARLEFSGNPVFGSVGIRSDFAGGALTRFQDLVAKVLAQEEHGNLGQRGVVPHRNEAALHLTNVVHGSFGFLLEEIGDEAQQPLLETALKTAVDKATHLIVSLADQDEERFTSALVTSDPRVFDAAKALFSFVRASNAVFHLTSGNVDRTFDFASITLAYDRSQVTQLLEERQELAGTLLGVLPEAHRFELQLVTGEVIEGSVSKEIERAQLLELLRDLAGQRVRAQVDVRRLEQPGKEPKRSYTLIAANLDG